jgi:hypothetical protein
MTVIRNNSISGINSITAQSGALNFYDSTGNTLSIGASVSGNITGNLTGNVTGPGNSTFDGSVGIGTDNPGYKVHVEGTGEVFLNVVGDVAPAGGGANLRLQNKNTTASALNQIQSADAGGQTTSAISFYNVDNTTNEGYMMFLTRPSGGGPTEAARFTSAGNLRFPSGQGIDFSANSNAAGMTSELLDDYEEGTFTPTFTAGTVSGGYTRQVGEYTKVGRLVTFTLTIDGDGNLQGAAQAIEIGGLPFTSRNAPELGGAQVTYPGNFDTTNNRRFWLVAQNNTTLSYRDSSANNINGNAVNNVNSQLNLCGYYFTDS